MIWFVLFLLSRASSKSSEAAPRHVPVLTPAGGRLWFVRDAGSDEHGQLFDVATDLDRPVLTFSEKSGVRVLRERAIDAASADFGAALLAFKLLERDEAEEATL